MNAAPAFASRAMALTAVAGLSVASGIGLLLLPGPTLFLLGMIAISAVVLRAGSRYGYQMLLVYLGILVLCPTMTIELGKQAIPVALSDFALVILAVQLMLAPRPPTAPPGHLSGVVRNLLLLNIAIIISLLLMPLAGTTESLLGSGLRYMRFAPALMVYAAAIRFVGTRRHLDRLFGVLMIVLLAQSAIGVTQFVLQVPLTFESTPEASQYAYLADGTMMRRAQGTIGESTALANLAGLGVLLSFYRLRFTRRGRGLFPYIVIAFGLTCMILTFSRGMTLSLGLGGAVFLLLTRGRRNARILGAVAVLLIAVVALNTVDYRYLAHFEGRFDLAGVLEERAGFDDYLTGRVSAWSRLFSHVWDNPRYLLFGVGYKAIANSQLLGSQIFGDNNYLSILVECGLFGLVALLALLVSCFRSGIQVLRAREAWRSEAGALVIAIWTMEVSYMCVSDVMTYWRVVPLLFVIHAVIATAREEQTGTSPVVGET